MARVFPAVLLGRAERLHHGLEVLFLFLVLALGRIGTHFARPVAIGPGVAVAFHFAIAIGLSITVAARRVVASDFAAFFPIAVATDTVTFFDPPPQLVAKRRSIGRAFPPSFQKRPARLPIGTAAETSIGAATQSGERVTTRAITPFGSQGSQFTT
jgi:hypothetical protein